MENLLCNEVCIMSPIAPVDNMHAMNDNGSSSYQADHDQDFEQTFGIFLEKEANYMPEKGYVMHVTSNNLISNARFKTICWLIKSQKRLNLSLGTIFMAANYLDRFISANQCQGWKFWMFELLSIACLSVACKFNETSFQLPLSEFQMEGIEHSFELSSIQRMELTLLRALGWRLCPTTPCSYTEILTSRVISLNRTLFDVLTERVNALLLSALLDSKFLEFRPCVIAVSAIRHIFEEQLPSTNDDFVAHFLSLVPQDHKDDLAKCQRMMMDKQLKDDDDQCSLFTYFNNCYCPSSPVTVLTADQFDSCGFRFDCSLLQMPQVNDIIPLSKRRKTEEYHNNKSLLLDMNSLVTLG